MSVLFTILLNLLQEVIKTIIMNEETTKKDAFFNMGAKIILLQKPAVVSNEESLMSKALKNWKFSLIFS